MIKIKQPVLGKLSYDGCISQMFNDQYTPADLLALYKSMGLQGHNGIDFYKGRGEPIYAAHSGKVIYAQRFPSITGNGVKILDENKGFATLYCHLDSISVVQGQNVTQGQIIGTMGNSGSEYVYMGVHLHFGLYETDLDGNTINTSNGFKGAIDPLPFMQNKDMKIIGDKRDNRQYAVGEDNVLHWIFGQPGQDSESLKEFHSAGILDKLEVEWRDNLNGLTVGSPWGALK